MGSLNTYFKLQIAEDKMTSTLSVPELVAEKNDVGKQIYDLTYSPHAECSLMKVVTFVISLLIG